jgi:hypothetical protein
VFVAGEKPTKYKRDRDYQSQQWDGYSNTSEASLFDCKKSLVINQQATEIRCAYIVEEHVGIER